MKKTTLLSTLLLTIGTCALLLTGCAQPDDPVGIENVTASGDNTYTLTYKDTDHDVNHEFILDLPAKTKKAPLILMLHGYGESAQIFRQATHLEEVAVPKGYGVVYVTGAPNPYATGSSNGWNYGIDEQGNNDLDFLKNFARYLQKEYGFDPDRTFAVGFSNGAFMTNRLAVEAPNTFAACVSVSGIMAPKVYEEISLRPRAAFFQVTGEKDDVVPKNSDGSAKYAKSPAVEDVIDALAASNQLDQVEETEIGKASVLTKITGKKSKKQVWHLFNKNTRHSWPEEKLTGVNVNELIMEFLDTQL
ncbi:MAG: prolyl oligopeptidase family serine peptidase [Lachnospiraceae bacterium]|nr:prolyl oligopeptidase family serine peptidase [Lachnospiraceae bacterium]